MKFFTESVKHMREPGDRTSNEVTLGLRMDHIEVVTTISDLRKPWTIEWLSILATRVRDPRCYTFTIKVV